MSFFEGFRDLWQKLRGKGPAAAVAFTLDLSEDRENKQISLEAGGLIVESCSGDLYAKINGPNGDGFNLRHVQRIIYPITALFLTNTAQSGKVARLLLLPAGMETTTLGDMARKAFYDRNANDVSQFVWTGPVGSHGWTERFRYTIPAGRQVMLTYAFLEINGVPIYTSGAKVIADLYVDPNHRTFLICCKDGAQLYVIEQAIYQHPYGYGNAIVGRTYSDDAVAHGIGLSAGLILFDV